MFEDQDAVPPALGVKHFHVVAFKNARQREDVANVVVDNQHLGAGELGDRLDRGRRRFGRLAPLAGLLVGFFAKRLEQLDQLRPLGGLFGHAEGAHVHHRLAPVGAGHDVDRHMAGIGIVLQEVEQHEAVDVGEAKV